MLDVLVAAKALLCQADLASLLDAEGWGDLVPWLLLWAPQGWWEVELLLQGNVVSPHVFAPSAPPPPSPPPPHSAAPHRPWETSKTLLSRPGIWCLHLSPFIIWQIFL